MIWGGHPGEWEGEHPVTVAEEVGAEGIYFAGWRGHHELPEGLAVCDAIVVPSVDDPFPQVPLEAMAVGLPVIASRSGGLSRWSTSTPPGPPVGSSHRTISMHWPTRSSRWSTTRRRLPARWNALAHARADLSWDGVVSRFESAYTAGTEHHRRAHGVGDTMPS